MMEHMTVHRMKKYSVEEIKERVNELVHLNFLPGGIGIDVSPIEVRKFDDKGVYLEPGAVLQYQIPYKDFGLLRHGELVCIREDMEQLIKDVLDGMLSDKGRKAELLQQGVMQYDRLKLSKKIS